MFVVFDDDARNEADICADMDEVRQLIEDRRDNDGDYFDNYVGRRMRIYTLGDQVPFTFVPARFEIGNIPTISDATDLVNDFTLLDLLERRDERENRSWLHRKEITLNRTVPDTYGSDLPEIPAGTVIRIDFSGDFGLYGWVNPNGFTRKIKVSINDLRASDFDGLF